jgi:hypothetical protein
MPGRRDETAARLARRLILTTHPPCQQLHKIVIAAAVAADAPKPKYNSAIRMNEGTADRRGN